MNTKKEHCPLRLAGQWQPPHLPCDRDQMALDERGEGLPVTAHTPIIAHAPVFSSEMASMTADGKPVRNVVVEVDCDYCAAKGNIPGGKYQAQGEVIRCPACNGHGFLRTRIPLTEFANALRFNVKER